MFKKYGVIGIILIVLVELNFFFKSQPFASRYFIFVWLGYILTIDALNYKLRKNSLLMNNTSSFIGLFFLSAIFWWVFELMNLKVNNWNYNGINGISIFSNGIWKTIYFSTVLPGFFETYELIRNIHLFDKLKLHKKHKISKEFLLSMIIIGAICFVLPLVLPKYFYPLIWLTFFFLLDPI